MSPFSPEQIRQATFNEAVKIVASEGISDEEAQIKRANDIFEDALKSTPETDAGKLAAKNALETLNNPQAALNIQKPTFDFTKHWDETGIKAVGDMIRTMGYLADFLPIPSQGTPEYEKASEDAYQKLSMEAFQILNDRNVGMARYKDVFDSLKSVISCLESLMMAQVTGHRHEIMSRQFGAKNPATGKFDANFALYQDLLDTRARIKKETGDSDDDYFNRKSE